jgi:hypothetical protein
MLPFDLELFYGILLTIVSLYFEHSYPNKNQVHLVEWIKVYNFIPLYVGRVDPFDVHRQPGQDSFSIENNRGHCIAQMDPKSFLHPIMVQCHRNACFKL